MTLGSSKVDSYGSLLLRYLPRSIHTEEEAEVVREQINGLIDKGDLTADEEEVLALLGDILHAWEEDRYAPPSAPAHEVVKALLEARGLRQKDLVGPVFPTESIASVVLHGKRKLTYDFVDRLSSFFGVSPEAFYGNGESRRLPDD